MIVRVKVPQGVKVSGTLTKPGEHMSATIDPESLRPVSSWEWNDIDSHWECKRCMSVNLNIPRVKSVNPHVFDGSRYCPHCGAKMED